MKCIKSIIILCCVVTQLYSSPTILFSGYNSDNSDDFTFFSTDTITAGETIYFTDQNYEPTNNRFADNAEGLLQWTADKKVTAGEVIAISKISASKGVLSEIKHGFNIANSNDIVWAYSLTSENKINLIAAFSTGAVTDSIMEKCGISAERFAVFSADNGIYTGTKTIKNTELPTFYDITNWSFTDGAGDQSINLDTSRFTIQAEAPELSIERNKSTISISAKISPATSKTVLCFDTIPIQNSNIADWFHLPDSAHSIKLKKEQPLITLPNLSAGKFYYFKAISFSPQNNALLPSKEHVLAIPAVQKNILLTDSIWEGRTSFFFTADDTIRSKKQAGAGSITFNRQQVDHLSIKILPYNHTLSNLNNLGLIIASDKSLDNHPKDEYWNGYFLQFGQNNGSDTVYLIQHIGKQNNVLQSIPINPDITKNGITISLDFLANNSIAVNFLINKAIYDKATIHCSQPIQSISHSGIFARSNSDSFSASFCDIAIEKYANRYKLKSNCNEISAQSWMPERTASYFSDALRIENLDSVALSSDFFGAKSLNIQNSNLYLINTDTVTETQLMVNNSLTVGKNSSICLTNTTTSNKPAQIVLPENAVLQIEGKLIADACGTIPNHEIICRNNASVLIKNGGKIIVTKQDGHLFDSESKYAVRFLNGSKFIQFDGKHPFGENTALPTTIFENGSVYQYYGGGISFAGRSYKTLILNTGDTMAIAMGSLDAQTKISHFHIKSGIYRFTAHANKSPLNISVDTLTIDSSARIDFSPTTPEAFSTLSLSNNSELKGSGTFSIGENALLSCEGEKINWKLNALIKGVLKLSGSSCLINVDSCSISIPGSVLGAGKNRFFVMPEGINDTICFITRPATAKSEVSFPIGTHRFGYAPVNITLNVDDSVHFKTRVFAGLYNHGLYGEENMADTTLGQTWEITPERQVAAQVEVSWQEEAEKPNFFRDYSRVIVNHHTKDDNTWHSIKNSTYSYRDNLHQCKANSVTSYSTFSAGGEGDLLGIYFTDFSIENKSSYAQISWLQTIPTDSTIIYKGTGEYKMIPIKTVDTKSIGNNSHNLKGENQNTYYQIRQYKNSQLVETSNVLFLPASVINKSWKVVSIKNGVFISNPHQELLTIKWFNLAGQTIAKSQSMSTDITLTIPSKCDAAFLRIESAHHEHSQVIINRE